MANDKRYKPIPSCEDGDHVWVTSVYRNRRGMVLWQGEPYCKICGRKQLRKA